MTNDELKRHAIEAGDFDYLGHDDLVELLHVRTMELDTARRRIADLERELASERSVKTIPEAVAASLDRLKAALTATHQEPPGGWQRPLPPGTFGPGDYGPDSFGGSDFY